ncbi:MAG: hypothetical protein AABZ74_00755 [Cyanobacteriota bacterium]
MPLESVKTNTSSTLSLLNNILKSVSGNKELSLEYFSMIKLLLSEYCKE